MARTFEAQYPGKCADCGERIRVGDEIGYDEDDQICCLDCLEDA